MRIDDLARLDSAARRIGSPCGDGEMIWRLWGDGPMLVLLHGNFGTWRHWVRNIDALSRRFTVVAPDAPGFGDSARPPTPTTAREMGGIMASGLDHVVPEGERANLVGFSFGGRLVGEMAAQRPDKVATATFVAPGGLGVADAPRPELAKFRPPMTEAEIVEVHRQNLAGLMIADPVAIDDLALHIQQLNTRATRFRMMASWPEEDSWDGLGRVLSRITVPVNGIWSTRDAFAGESIGERMDLLRRVHPDAQIRVMEGVGHWMQYEAPEAFDALLVDLLNERATSVA